MVPVHFPGVAKRTNFMQLKACRREATLVVATAQFFANKPTLPKERPRGRTVLRKSLLPAGGDFVGCLLNNKVLAPPCLYNRVRLSPLGQV